MGVMIATPMRGRAASGDYVVGLMQCNGVHDGWMPMFGQSDVYVARNTLINQFYKTEHQKLIFIDSDIGFTRQDLIDLVHSPAEYVSGLYPAKGDEPEWVFRDENMALVPFDRVPPRGLLMVGLLGCGFLKIERSALDKIVAAGLPTPYGVAANKIPNYQFFNGRVFKDNLLSEDYGFSVMAAEAGVHAYVNCGIRVSHDGRRK
jgi:hypothetical protein